MSYERLTKNYSGSQEDSPVFEQRLVGARLNGRDPANPHLAYPDIDDPELRTASWTSDFISCAIAMASPDLDMSDKSLRNPDPREMVRGLKANLAPAEVIAILKRAKGLANESTLLNGDQKSVTTRISALVRETRQEQSKPKRDRVSRQVDSGQF